MGQKEVREIIETWKACGESCAEAKNFPRENALIERSFRTDEDEFFLLLDQPPGDINELN